MHLVERSLALSLAAQALQRVPTSKLATPESPNNRKHFQKIEGPLNVTEVREAVGKGGKRQNQAGTGGLIELVGPLQLHLFQSGARPSWPQCCSTNVSGLGSGTVIQLSQGLPCCNKVHTVR